MTPDNTEIIIYQTDDGRTKIDVRMEADTVWLTQAQMAELLERIRDIRSSERVFYRQVLDLYATSTGRRVKVWGKSAPKERNSANSPQY